MANKEQVKVFHEGVEVWNKWKFQQLLTDDRRLVESSNTDWDVFGIRVDLSKLDLRYSKLEGIDLSMVDLSGTDLSYSNLKKANLLHAKLKGANLHGAMVYEANLNGADLRDADLKTIKLIEANLKGVNLSSADMRGSVINDVDFTDASFHNTDMTDATMYNVIFGNNDISSAKGLDTVRMLGPLVIGIDTIYLSKGNISELFLRNAGVPENFITYMASLTGKAFEFYSCFISYSNNDQAFAERLYADLQSKGVRSWFAPEDLKIEAEIRIGIDESIRKHDKVLLVLSETSVKSQWVQQEVETALAKESEQARTVLFPIRLDDSVMHINTGWPALIKNTRNIGDFKNWKEHEAYQKSFQRLLRDLKAVLI